MRKVSVRQFQRNFYLEVENLPIVVTKRGKPFIVVTSPGAPRLDKKFTPRKELENVVTTKNVVPKYSGGSKMKVCLHGRPSGACKICGKGKKK